MGSIAAGESHSYMTILEPRFSGHSDIVSVYGAVMMVDEKVKKKRRLNFFLFSLNYCLGLGNIWRFPRQAMLYEEYAAFVYLYIIFNMGFGISLLFLEGALGQYSSRGFTRTFAFCPFLEGITFSMIFYGIIANIFYNALAAYSFLYIFTAFHPIMPHSYYPENPREYKYNLSKQMGLPEHSYFFNDVATTTGDDGIPDFHWKIFIILMIIWTLNGFVIYYGIFMKHHKICLVLCIIIISVLIVTTIISVAHPGAAKGLLLMFVPNPKYFMDLSTWVHSLEQSLISLGIGSGPILTFWSGTKYITWSYCDLLTVNVISIICAMLSGLIVFSTLGVIATEQNRTIAEIFITNETKHSDDMQLHIVVTHLFNRLHVGVSNLMVFLFNFMLICSFVFTAVQYTYTFICLMKRLTKKDKIVYHSVVFVCLTSFLLGIITTTNVGLQLMMAIDDIFLGPPLLILVFCELISVSYYYGLSNFCDDIEFLLLFVPGVYYQFCWMVLPIFFFVFIICSLYVKCKEVLNIYRIIMLSAIFILIICPIIVFGSYRTYSEAKAKRLARLEDNRELQLQNSRNQPPPSKIQAE